MFYCCACAFFFFFKQKTAYEMRISDWSSDVCSSDLFNLSRFFQLVIFYTCTGKAGATAMAISMERAAAARASFTKARFQGIGHEFVSGGGFFRVPASPEQIGRASCRERVCQYV